MLIIVNLKTVNFHIFFLNNYILLILLIKIQLIFKQIIKSLSVFCFHLFMLIIYKQRVIFIVH